MNSNEGREAELGVGEVGCTMEAELGIGCANVIDGDIAGVELEDLVTRLVPDAALEGPDLGKAEDLRVRIMVD